MPEGRQVLQSFKSATDGAQKIEQGLPGTTAFGSRGRRKDTTTRRQKPSYAAERTTKFSWSQRVTGRNPETQHKYHHSL